MMLLSNEHDIQACQWFVNLAGDSFMDYFVSYAQKLSAEQYPSVNGEILRYVCCREIKSII